MAASDPLADLTPYELQQQIFDDAWPWWRQKFEATEELTRFLSGDRYVDDHGQFNKDRRGVQIRGQETDDTIRHVVAKATERPRNIEARPIDSQDDVDLAEAKVALIQNKLADPYIGFERELYKGLVACQEGRRSVVWMDWCPDSGPYGRIIWSYQQQGTVMWDAAYHPHHPMCDWLIRHRRIDYRQANRMYGVDWLRPDHEGLIKGTTNWRSGIPIMSGFTDRAADMAVKDNRVTIREIWLKNDHTEDGKPVTKKRTVLPKGQRYMTCADGCGQYRSQTNEQLKSAGMGLPGGWPESIPAATHEGDMSGCPMCGGELTRIDAIDATQAQLKYAKGKRLICVAPFCPGPKGSEHLYNGAWPVPTLRSFPALFLFASVNPADESGGYCLVDKMWDAQVASDSLQTMLVQRVFEHRDYWRMPSVGFYNARGDRFEFRDDDENVIFEDKSKSNKYGPATIEHIAGTGADPEGIPVWNVINSGLTRYRPQADIEPVYGQANDANVGTVQAQIQQAEVTTADFVRRRNQELSMAIGVYDDMLTATITPEEIQRLNMDGKDVLERMHGDSMPNYDYVVEETPEFLGINAEKSKAWDAGIQVAMTLGPEALESWGNFHSVPRSVVRSIQKLFADKQAAMDQQSAMGGAPGADGSVQPGMPSAGTGAHPMMNGQNGAGMSPALAG